MLLEPREYELLDRHLIQLRKLNLSLEQTNTVNVDDEPFLSDVEEDEAIIKDK